jgi:hypothetical protein
MRRIRAVILAVYRATNLLSPFEKTRMQESGPNADPFIRAVAGFTLGEGKPALLDMERALKPHDNAKWTVVTYLPFLWQPDQHMYLKPKGFCNACRPSPSIRLKGATEY